MVECTVSIPRRIPQKGPIQRDPQPGQNVKTFCSKVRFWQDKVNFNKCMCLAVFCSLCASFLKQRGTSEEPNPNVSSIRNICQSIALIHLYPGKTRWSFKKVCVSFPALQIILSQSKQKDASHFKDEGLECWNSGFSLVFFVFSIMNQTTNYCMMVLRFWGASGCVCKIVAHLSAAWGEILHGLTWRKWKPSRQFFLSVWYFQLWALVTNLPESLCWRGGKY